MDSRTTDQARDLLHRAGWGTGETAYPGTWQVECARGNVLVIVRGPTQALAWLAALAHVQRKASR